MKRQTMLVNWSSDHQTWVATDPSRIGCCAVSPNKTKVRAEMRELQREYDRAAIRHLSKAIEETERYHPLPRCQHGSVLRDGGGERLEPPCGCRNQ